MPVPDEAAPEPAAGPRTVLFDLDGVITVDDTFARFMRERYAGLARKLLLLPALPWLALVRPFSWRLAVRTLVHVGLLGIGERRYGELARDFASRLVRRPRQFRALHPGLVVDLPRQGRVQFPGRVVGNSREVDDRVNAGEVRRLQQPRVLVEAGQPRPALGKRATAEEEPVHHRDQVPLVKEPARQHRPDIAGPSRQQHAPAGYGLSPRNAFGHDSNAPSRMVSRLDLAA